MFHMQDTVVDRDLVRSACAQLGWSGDTAGPIVFAGMSFWAVYRLNQNEDRRRRERGVGGVIDREALADLLRVSPPPAPRTPIRPPLTLVGCLVPGRGCDAIARASMLSGYAARAVLVPDQDDIVQLLVDAALLDQGVVVYRDGGVTAFAQAGPKVRGLGFDAREWELLETVYASHTRLCPA